MLMVFMPDSDVQYQLALLLTVFFSVPSSLKLFDCFVHCIVNRKKGLTRGRNSMQFATSLVTRLGDLYLQNLIVTMPTYVIINSFEV